MGVARRSPLDEARTTSAARRHYTSPLREQQAKQTRERMLAAATGLFTTHGWAATGMRDVAREAGTATETVYAHFASKADLLRQVIDIAVVGDEAPVPLAARPEFAAQGEGSRAERIAAAARLVTAVNVRTAGIHKALREAAHTDQGMAELLAAGRERQRRDVEAAMTLVSGRAPTEREVDGVWALVSIEVYLLLVETRGWSLEQYESWMAETLELVLPSS
jgi:AcrR family transcriptional regulator